MTQSVPISNDSECHIESDTEIDCSDLIVHETDNDSELAEHNYSSFILIPQQAQTEI